VNKQPHKLPRRLTQQRGIALIMVLVTLATVSLLAVKLNDRTLFSTQRTLNRAEHEQVFWYVHGAGQLARQQLESTLNNGPAALLQLLKQAKQHYPAGLATDNAEISLAITSGHNCFNLNSLAPGAGQNTAQQVFNHVLQTLNFTEQSRLQLSDRLLDWLDPDNQRRPQGAEHTEYLNTNSYSADTSLTSLAILPQLWPEYLGPHSDRIKNAQVKTLLPLLCVYPGYTGLNINIDHLKPEQAVLLSAVSKGKIAMELATTLINNRPDTGYKTMQGLLKTPELEALELQETQLTGLSFEPHYFRLEVTARYRQSTLARSYLVKAQNNQTEIIRVSRVKN